MRSAASLETGTIFASALPIAFAWFVIQRAIQTLSFRDGALAPEPQMCNRTSGNLEIPGSMLRITPE